MTPARCKHAIKQNIYFEPGDGIVREWHRREFGKSYFLPGAQECLDYLSTHLEFAGVPEFFAEVFDGKYLKTIELKSLSGHRTFTNYELLFDCASAFQRYLAFLDTQLRGHTGRD